MAVIPEFVPPDFMQGQDVETIHQRMRDNAPADLDKAEGTHFWNFTRPVAIEKAEMIELVLFRTLQLMFPQFATGVYLDYHGQEAGVTRLPATKATGVVTFTASEGTIIPLGTIVATVGTEDTPPIQFITTEEVTVDSSGLADVAIEAVEPGTIGNVPAGAITVLVTQVSGVTAVTNANPTTGGTEEEDDEAYRLRILDRHQNKSMSGAIRDYERWAQEVPGVGGVTVIPEWNGPGTVKLIIVDANGEPANQQLIENVQNYIAPEDGDGLAPIGAEVTVAAPTRTEIDIDVDLILESDDYDLQGVIDSIKKALRAYFIQVGIGGVVRYNEIGAIIINADGVLDYDNLLVNGGTENVQLEPDEIAIVGTINGGGGEDEGE